MDSMPPARTTSLWPKAIPWEAKVMDLRPEEQTLLTPVQMVETGRPDSIEAWRAGDWPIPALITLPSMTSDTWLGDRLAWDSEAFIVVAAS